MKYLLIIIGLVFSFSLSSQSIGSYVISSAGNSIMNENGGLYFSVGEPLNTELSDGEIMISQGFLQITIAEGTNSNSEILENSFSVYPNPTSYELYIQQLEEGKNRTAILYTSLGEQIASTSLFSSVQKIDLSSLESGTYFLKMFDEKQILGTYSIIKL